MKKLLTKMAMLVVALATVLSLSAFAGCFGSESGTEYKHVETKVVLTGVDSTTAATVQPMVDMLKTIYDGYTIEITDTNLIMKVGNNSSSTTYEIRDGKYYFQDEAMEALKQAYAQMGDEIVIDTYGTLEGDTFTLIVDETMTSDVLPGIIPPITVHIVVTATFNA